MQYEIAHAEKFPLELGKVPKKVHNAYFQWHQKFKHCEIEPKHHNPPVIKRLTNYKNLWRLKISDNYRLVYKVEPQKRILTMMMIDHRNKIYERLGINADGEPGTRIVEKAEELLEKKPTPEQVIEAGIALANQEVVAEKTKPDNLLPSRLTPNILEDMRVPQKYYNTLCNLGTEGELMNADNIPDLIKERIMEYYWPSKIEEVTQRPVRIARNSRELEEAADGRRKLESFLLKLDDEQEDFVTRFKSDSRPIGPWLLKGGPGSGKSTIALYCVRSLLDSLHQLGLFEKDQPLKILYTTYTNSLVRVSEYLLNILGVQKSSHEVDVKTVDSVAARYLPSELNRLGICVGNECYDVICEAIDKCSAKIKNFSFSNSDRSFLLEEIDWMIIGQDLDNVKQYLDLDRSGRGRALGRHQRHHLWTLYEELIKVLRERDQCLFSERLKYASKNVTPNYDYIFIDEAQDLKPVAIRFLMGLCKNRKNIYLTADINQSIWGYSFSWTKMARDLRVQGRAKILRRNYRTTKDIWEAVLQLAPNNEVADNDTLLTEAVYRGNPPVLAWYEKNSQIKERLNIFLYEALRQERFTPGSAAVLCPTNKEVENVYNMIDKSFKPKIMESKSVDISWSGIKILTMHAAKGLEFPVVAVTGLEKGRLPSRALAGVDEDEHIAQQRRLLFVACSRAMRRLIVFAHKGRLSPFVTSLSDDYWDMEVL